MSTFSAAHIRLNASVVISYVFSSGGHVASQSDMMSFFRNKEKNGIRFPLSFQKYIHSSIHINTPTCPHTPSFLLSPIHGICRPATPFHARPLSPVCQRHLMCSHLVHLRRYHRRHPRHHSNPATLSPRPTRPVKSRLCHCKKRLRSHRPRHRRRRSYRRRQCLYRRNVHCAPRRHQIPQPVARIR